MKFWVRNLERQPVASFWLPTSTDRFYPDFVVQLNDGRILVVEYKGAHLFNGDDSKEKRTIGEVWAAASKGRCRFVMVTDKELAGKSVAAQLRAALA
ncbi:MAG: hypothetical protein AABM33_13490 [Pseudomonadota bacterium]